MKHPVERNALAEAAKTDYTVSMKYKWRQRWILENLQFAENVIVNKIYHVPT